MRIAMCEDDARHALILKDIIQKWAKNKDIIVDVRYFENAEEFLFHWDAEGQFDLAFLDIEMAKMNGMQLAKNIRAIDKTMLIVFTTGLKDYVFRGYDIQAFHYLLKPLKEQECFSVLSKAAVVIENKEQEVFVIMQENQIVRLYKDEIYYFEVEAHYVVAHTIHGDYRYKEKLSNIESVLSEPNFCRCHRSYLINLRHVRVINRDKVQLSNMVYVPVSRNSWKTLNECFIKFYMPNRH